MAVFGMLSLSCQRTIYAKQSGLLILTAKAHHSNALLSQFQSPVVVNSRLESAWGRAIDLVRLSAQGRPISPRPGRALGCAAFTLAEVVVSLAIASTVITGIVTGYINCVYRAEWLACSVAAQSLATQRIEQVRAARWDTLANPLLDEVTTNQFPVTIQPLDLPRSGDKVIIATNRTFITVISTDPPVRLISVECTWRYPGRGVFTNMVNTYRCPAQ